MRLRCQAGTPSHLDEKFYESQARAKSWLHDSMMRTETWGEKFSHATRDQARAAREQMHNLDFAGLTVGDVRTWSARDDASGVTFTWKVTVIEK